MKTMGYITAFVAGAYAMYDIAKKDERKLIEKFKADLSRDAVREEQLFEFVINKLGPHAPAEVVKDVEDVLKLEGILVEKESTDAPS